MTRGKKKEVQEVTRLRTSTVFFLSNFSLSCEFFRRCVLGVACITMHGFVGASSSHPHSHRLCFCLIYRYVIYYSYNIDTTNNRVHFINILFLVASDEV